MQIRNERAALGALVDRSREATTFVTSVTDPERSRIRAVARSRVRSFSPTFIVSGDIVAPYVSRFGMYHEGDDLSLSLSLSGYGDGAGPPRIIRMPGGESGRSPLWSDASVLWIVIGKLRAARDEDADSAGARVHSRERHRLRHRFREARE